MRNLQDTLNTEFGKRTIMQQSLPEYFDTSLSKDRTLRPYQEECFKYLLTYMNPENVFDGKLRRPHLLFHMATGSGKTLIMAGTMLYLYEQGYRNFLFFVDSNNIVEKTKDNFLHSASSKYLFAPQIIIGGKQVEIRQVENFQGTDGDGINLCLTTIQGLHTQLNSNKENALTYDDFSDQPVVLISDEAHHLNSATKKKKQSVPSFFDDDEATEYDDELTRDWETTVMRIFNKVNGRLPNILLEFTATEDLSDPNIARKYENKVIFDYPLKKFREDMYSKEVEVVSADLAPIDRSLQAIILSQYKRKLFLHLKQDVKPVVLLKSKTIAENKKFIEQFKQTIAQLTEKDIQKIRDRATDVMQRVFDHFDAQGITMENLILELQEDFSDERLLLVDGNNITSEKQQLLNSLEAKDNGIRAVFAVDMLNEGWDVLNLFDIVRLYDSRDAKNGKPGKTTMQEAQLIGRGARYMPFTDPDRPELPVGKRKYDMDAGNPLRDIETLHYHSAHNPRYIQELHKALVQTGIVAPQKVERWLLVKDDVKQTETYQHCLVFVNHRIPLPQADKDGTLKTLTGERPFVVTMPTGKMKTGLLFSEKETAALSTITLSIRMGELGRHVVRAAMNSFATFHFDQLHHVFSKLTSVTEFISSDDYLNKLSVKVIGKEQTLEGYTQQDKLYIAKSVLSQIEPLMIARGKSFEGSKEFKPMMLSKAISERKLLTFSIKPDDSDKEFGTPMNESVHPHLRINLDEKAWYVQNDCFGTYEEKALIKFIEGRMPILQEKYEPQSIFLVRNEQDICIYSFKEGRRFEPDFLLFMKRKGEEERYDNIQFFIEPKGEHLKLTDKWKQDFLLEIEEMADIRFCMQSESFSVLGLPFYSEKEENLFADEFDRWCK